eukprot:356618-Chlamydomonas_euryale.AAC.3
MSRARAASSAGDACKMRRVIPHIQDVWDFQPSSKHEVRAALQLHTSQAASAGAPAGQQV